MKESAKAGVRRSNGQPHGLTICESALRSDIRATESAATAHGSAPDRAELAEVLAHLPGLAYRRRGDRHWTLEFVSAGAEALTGYRPDQLLGDQKTAYGRLICPADRRRAWREVQTALRARQPFGILYRLRTASGELRWVWEQGQGVYAPTGRLRAVEGFVADMTPCQRADTSLRDGEERFRALVEATSDWIWEVDENATYTYASPKVRDLLGYAPEEVLGRTPFDLMPPDEAERVGRLFAEIAAARRPFAQLENTNLHRDGRRVVLETSGVPVFDPAGRFRGYRGVDRDITERKRTEAALVEAEANLQNIVDTVPELLFVLRAPDFAPQFISRAGPELLGFPITESLADPDLWLRQIHEDDRGRVLAALRTAIHTGRDFNVDVRIRHKDGVTLRWFEGRGRVKRDAAGRATALYGALSDISARKEAEIRLREERDRAQRYLDTAGVMLVALDRNGNVELLNSAGCETLGCREQEVLGSNWFDRFLPADVREETREAFLAMRHGAADLPLYYRSRVVTCGGKTRFIAWHHRILTGADGRFTGTLSSGTDITEQQRAEETLQEQIRQHNQVLVQTIMVVAKTIEKRDPYTSGHQQRVAELAVAMAQGMGFSAHRIEGIRLGGLIHDIGKIYVPAEILNRPGRLTTPEFEMIKSHAQVGYDIIREVEFPWPVAQMVLQHHERLDGTGYPQGLKGDAIVIEARILAIADVVEAITSHRPYRPGLGIETALDEIRRGRGVVYDAAAVDACVRLIAEQGFAFNDPV